MEELYGAKGYAECAVSYKVTNPAWTKSYLDMSSAELGHAASLFKMFEEMCSSMKKKEEANKSYLELLSAIHEETSSEYIKLSAEVKYMHELAMAK